MAHGDYNCCAICDCKMEYNPYDAKTKEQICVQCIENTIDLGKPITRPEQIEEHLATLSDDAVEIWLRNVEFRCCFYPNDVDEYVNSRGFDCR